MQRLLNLLFTGLLAIIQRFLRFPSQLLFTGPGSAEQLATHLVRLGHRRVLIVTDSILVELGVAEGIDGGEQALDLEPPAGDTRRRRQR